MNDRDTPVDLRSIVGEPDLGERSERVGRAVRLQRIRGQQSHVQGVVHILGSPALAAGAVLLCGAIGFWPARASAPHPASAPTLEAALGIPMLDLGSINGLTGPSPWLDSSPSPDTLQIRGEVP